MHNLEYEHLKEYHAEYLLKIWGDKNVIKFTNIKEPCSLNKIKKRISLLKLFDVFVINYYEELIGIIGCPCIDIHKYEFGVFYQIRKDFWNKGIATEAMNWILNYMKEKYSKFVLYGDVVEANIASEKILKKFQFQYISEDKNCFECNNTKMTIRHYKLKVNK